MMMPPSVNAPNFLQLWSWIMTPLEFLHKYERECGDTFTVNMSGGFEGAIFTSNPAAIQQLLTSDTKQFSAPGETNQILQPFIGKNGVILLDGSEHRQRRQLVMPSFHGDKVRLYTDLMRKITQDTIANWQIGETINVREQMQSISLSIILQTVFGLYRGDRYDEIREQLIDLLTLVESPLSSGLLFFPSLQLDLGAWSPWGKFLRRRELLDRLIYAEITERRAEERSNRSDILSLLIDSQDADGNGMNDEELRDELMTLLFAGHETTATALAWAIYWINYLPEVKEKLLAEIATVDPQADAMAIGKLPYLSAVCSETLRIYPVGMLTFPRLTKEPLSFQGYDLPEHTMVVGCIYLTHHREDIYPEPDKFKPERFLNRQFSPYEYFPFGGGARRCIGMALAQLELKLVLFEAIANCQLQLTGELPVAPVRRGVTLGPKGGVTAKVVGKR
jgi:cytochrome P450 family 110